MDIHLQSQGDSQTWLNTKANECCATFSPDGKLLAYISDETGNPEIYIRPYPGSAPGRQISTKGGREPVWSRTANELFYWQDRQLMRVDVGSGESLENRVPQPLFQGVFVSSTSTWRSRFDISPIDGEIIIIKRGPEEMGVTELKLVPDWFENQEFISLNTYCSWFGL